MQMDNWKAFSDQAWAAAVAYTAEPAPVQGETRVMAWERFTKYLMCKNENTWLRTAYYMTDMQDVKALRAEAEEPDIDISSATTRVPRGRAD